MVEEVGVEPTMFQCARFTVWCHAADSDLSSIMVDHVGLEPTTYSLQSYRSSQLS